MEITSAIRHKLINQLKEEVNSSKGPSRQDNSTNALALFIIQDKVVDCKPSWSKSF